MNRKIGFVSNVENDEQKLYMKSFKLGTLEKRGLEKVIEIYRENIQTTQNVLRYCKNNGIKFYRMGSLFPFCTHEILKSFDYLNFFDDEIYELSQFIKFSGIRISIHSSPYCVLNSINPEIVKKSVIELKHHSNFMNVLNLPNDNLTVVHVGGINGGKQQAKKRFIDNFNSLEEKVRKRIVLENDDKIFSLADVEEISKFTTVPIVMDVFHHRVYNPEGIEEIEALKRAFKTWQNGSTPEIHYSSQDPEKAKGSHSADLNLEDFTKFIDKTRDLNFDIMLETKGTNTVAENVIRLIS